MTDQEIIDNAPEGATHIDGEYDFCKDGYFFDYPSKQWIPSEFIVESRSLADIAKIEELEKENKELQECFDECYEELRLTRDDGDKRIAELEKERDVEAVRDLRQQAIGVSKAAKYLSTDNYDEYQDLTQMIIDAESAEGSLITIMYHAWLHKAKALKEQE